MKIKVFKKEETYCEKTDTYSDEREIVDCDFEYVIQDRYGRVGIVQENYHNDRILWVDEDNKYRIER